MAKAQKQNLHFTKDTLGSVLLRESPMMVCVFLSVILILLEATNSQKLDDAKMTMQNTLAPIFSSTSKITNTIDDFFLNFNTVSELNKKNEALLKENANMEMWRNRALRFEAENLSLKDLLKFKKPRKYDFESARIAIDNSNSFNRAIIVDAGELEKNQSVVSAHGLIGRVLNVAAEHSRVLLITDINSKVPAVIERNRTKVIASGRNTKQLRLEYLPEDADITVGDRLITSGDGAVYVPGLLIGTVSYIEDSKVKIKPATDFNRIEFVSILRERD